MTGRIPHATEESAPVSADSAGPTAARTRTGQGATQIVRPVRALLTACVILVVVCTAAGIVPMVGIVELARILLPSAAGEHADTGRAWLVVWLSVAALALRLATLIAAGWLSHLADLNLSLHIRRSLVDRLGRLPLGWFGDRNSGLVKKAVQDDVAALHHLVAHAVLEVTAAVTGPVVVAAYLFAVDWRMALITLAPIAAGAAGYTIAMRGSAERFREYDASMAKLGSASVEFVNGIAVVKAFGRFGRAHRRFAEDAEAFTAFYRGWLRHSALGMIVMELAIAPVTTVFVVLVGGTALVQSGSLAPVDLVPFVVLGLAMTAALLTVGAGAQALRAAVHAARRIATLLREPELPQPAAHGPVRVPADGRVEFRGVSFAYDDTPVLRGVDLTLRPGTVTALVGPSGSGKSTLARLLPRFADVTAGSISIGGVDVRELTSAELYSRISFVFQDASLLRTSLRDNIRLADPEAPDTAVRAAAAAAQIASFIEDLPRGYDTVVGADVTLSGGQAQRVSIARALLADTPILVLDEATASADPESEAQVQQAISRLVAGRTLLVIAHRLSTVTGADQIVVLDEGRVIERGTHTDLLAAEGRYARMWAADQRGRLDVPGADTTTEAATR